MMDILQSIVAVVVTPILGACAGGAVGWLLQSRLYTRLHGVNELKHRFYAYLDLVSGYWVGGGADAEKRRALEAQMLAQQLIIMTDYSILAKRIKRVRISQNATEEHRIALWDATTGGHFQQKEWQPDSGRVRQAADAVAHIVKSLY